MSEHFDVLRPVMSADNYPDSVNSQTLGSVPQKHYAGMSKRGGGGIATINTRGLCVGY